MWGALLYKLEAAVQLGYTRSACTDVPCQWNQNFTKNIQPKQIGKIKFYSKEAKDKVVKSTKAPKRVATQLEQEAFIAALAKHGRFVGMSGFAAHSSAYVKQAQPAPTKLPDSLGMLFEVRHCQLSTKDLETLCKDFVRDYTITREVAGVVEEATKQQASSKHWYAARVGRITASIAHQALHTSQSNPAPSLLKKICTEVKPLRVPAVQWGVDHEEDALNVLRHTRAGFVLPSDRPTPYNVLVSDMLPHSKWQLSKAGLTISVEQPFIAASPDAMVTCACCGRGAPSDIDNHIYVLMTMTFASMVT